MPGNKFSLASIRENECVIIVETTCDLPRTQTSLSRWNIARNRTLKFKSNEPRNTQNGSGNPPITNHNELLFPKRSAKRRRFFRVWLTSQKNLAYFLYGVFPSLSVKSLRWRVRGERAILVPRATRLNLQRIPYLKTTWPRNDGLWGRECERAGNAWTKTECACVRWLLKFKMLSYRCCKQYTLTRISTEALIRDQWGIGPRIDKVKIIIILFCLALHKTRFRRCMIMKNRAAKLFLSKGGFPLSRNLYVRVHARKC